MPLARWSLWIQLWIQQKTGATETRRYLNDRRMFLSQYSRQMCKICHVIPIACALSQAARPLVAKAFKAESGTAIGWHRVNAAIRIKLQIFTLPAKLCHFHCRYQLESLEFCGGYWQFPLEPACFDGCVVIAPQGSFDAKIVFNGPRNASTHFHSTIPLVFSSIPKP